MARKCIPLNVLRLYVCNDQSVVYAFDHFNKEDQLEIIGLFRLYGGLTYWSTLDSAYSNEQFSYYNGSLSNSTLETGAYLRDFRVRPLKMIIDISQDGIQIEESKHAFGDFHDIVRGRADRIEFWINSKYALEKLQIRDDMEIKINAIIKENPNLVTQAKAAIEYYKKYDSIIRNLIISAVVSDCRGLKRMTRSPIYDRHLLREIFKFLKCDNAPIIRSLSELDP
jgi:hypothetical protein